MSHAERLVIYLLAAALASAAVAWIAFQIQQEGVAPAVLFPILVGAALGAALVALGRFARLPARRWAVFGAVCWGLLAACAQDYIGHRYRLRLYDGELSRQNPLATAAAREGEMRLTFTDHLAGKLRAKPVWWTLDLVLTAAAAGIVAALGSRNELASRARPPGAHQRRDADLE